jgi:hypothetical protein
VELSAVVSAQLAQKPQGGRPESGERKAARELGTDGHEIQRAVKFPNFFQLVPELRLSLHPDTASAAGDIGEGDRGLACDLLPHVLPRCFEDVTI